jgi:hypothetical protein
MSRTFEVRQHETVYRTVTWRVEADSFEEAEQMVYDGDAEWYDSDEYDSEYGDIHNVQCQDCYETDESECECERVDHEFMAEIGL